MNSRIRTKGLAVLMAGLVSFSMMPAAFVFADSEITEFTIQEENETTEETVQIGTWDELKAFIDGINGINGEPLALNMNAALTADIVVPEEVGNDWIPLACDMEHTYQGTFDGGGYTVTGINVIRDRDHSYYPDPWTEGTPVHNYTAFLSFLGENGVVKNLNVEACITDVNDVAGIVSQNCGMIENCTFYGELHSEIYPNEAGEPSPFHADGFFDDSTGESGCIAAANSGLISACTAKEGSVLYRGGVCCGGIVGQQIQGSVVSNCTNYADISCVETGYETLGVYVGGAGGIVGTQRLAEEEEFTMPLDNAKPVIIGCANYGSVSCEQLFGGICGQCWGGDVMYCENHGNVDHLEANWCGGIVGYLTSDKTLGLENGATIRDCVNFTDVNPSGLDSATGQCKGVYVGGIVGAAEDIVNEFTGKLISPVCVYGCFNVGSVSGNFGVGGTIGYVSNGLVDESTNIFELVNLGTIRGNDCVGGVIGACPGIAASLINFGSVILIPLENNAAAGGLTGSLSISGNISTGYNLGNISTDGTGSYTVYLGGAAGEGSGDLPGCYYCAVTSGSAKSLNGSDPDSTERALSLRQMSGEDAKTSMPDLFDCSDGFHPATIWNTVENVVEGETTYLMTPQYEGISIPCYDINAVVDITDHTIDLSTADVIIPNASYNGKTQVPNVTVRLNGMALTEGVDYETDAGSYTDVGKYKIKVTGRGNYDGEISAYFKIVRGKSTVTVADKTVTYTGKKVSSKKAKVTGSKGDVTYTYYSDAKCTKKIKASKVVDAGTYYVKATVAGDSKYKSATSKAAKITIKKAKQEIGTVKPLKKTIAAGESYQLTTKLTKGNGTIVYAKTRGIPGIKVSKTGKVTVAKGTKAKQYTVRIEVTAKKTKNYNAASAKKKLTITVK